VAVEHKRWAFEGQLTASWTANGGRRKDWLAWQQGGPTRCANFMPNPIMRPVSLWNARAWPLRDTELASYSKSRRILGFNGRPSASKTARL